MVDGVGGKMTTELSKALFFPPHVRGETAMYEVIATNRSDFSEHLIDRFSSLEGAQERARQFLAQHYPQIVRVWIRVVRTAETEL
jgi:hypothetical protein